MSGAPRLGDNGGHRSRKLTVLVFVLFFRISLLTNMMGSLIPEVIRDFRLSLAAAGLLPFAFFLSYGLVSVPSGMLVERTSARRVVLWALVLMFPGALAFPSFQGMVRRWGLFFLIGVGAAALQVVINLAASGRRRGTLCLQLRAGAVHLRHRLLLGPQLYSYLVPNLGRANQSSWLGVLAARTPPPTRGFPVLGVHTGRSDRLLVTAAVRSRASTPPRRSAPVPGGVTCSLFACPSSGCSSPVFSYMSAWSRGSRTGCHNFCSPITRFIP